MKFDNIYTVIPDNSIDTVINAYKRVAKVSMSKDHIDLIKNNNPVVTSSDCSIFNLSASLNEA